MNVLSTAASTQCMPKVLVYYNDEISEIGNLINVQKKKKITNAGYQISGQYKKPGLFTGRK